MPRFRTLIPILAIGILLFAQRSLERWTAARESAWVPPGDSERQKWDPRVVAVASLGHTLAVADGLWLGFLLDQNLVHVSQGRHSGVFADLDLATDLDPAYFEAYISGASSLAVVRDDEEGAARLLEKAEWFMSGDLESYSHEFRERVWSDRWLVPLLLAYVYLFEMDDLPSAARAFQRAALIEGSPPYLQSLSERLRKPDGIYEVAERLLRFFVSRTSDPEERARHERRLFSVMVSRFLRNLNQEFTRFTGGRSRGEAIRKAWPVFLQSRAPEGRDPWGGRLFIDADSRIESTTPREPVLGIPAR